MVYNIFFLTKNQNIHVTKAIQLIFLKKKVIIFKDIDKNVAFLSLTLSADYILKIKQM